MVDSDSNSGVVTSTPGDSGSGSDSATPQNKFAFGSGRDFVSSSISFGIANLPLIFIPSSSLL